MKPHTLIIADVHPSPDEQHPINQAFYRFLESDAPQAEALYILGDLFEMWVGDDIGLEIYKTAINKLASLTQAGLPVYLLFGNRDFLMRKAFWQATGIQPIKEPYALNLYGHKLLMLHGDCLCTDDVDYQRARKILRNPIVMWLFLKLSKKRRLKIGSGMRNRSTQLNQSKAETIMDTNESAVLQLLARHPKVTNLIHGHTHRPQHHPLKVDGSEKHRWVLGDWRPKAQIIVVTEDEINFRSI